MINNRLSSYKTGNRHLAGSWTKGLSIYYSVSVTYFMPLVSFYTPWKHHKVGSFLIFSGGAERPVAWNGLKSK